MSLPRSLWAPLGNMQKHFFCVAKKVAFLSISSFFAAQWFPCISGGGAFSTHTTGAPTMMSLLGEKCARAVRLRWRCGRMCRSTGSLFVSGRCATVTGKRQVRGTCLFFFHE
ncbi:hypothetical protein TW95_gp0947 [Pandoravirus inopinatum]|uniref:Uncharacterized protein n=1 Tax=Pandoravirus inopinatum TaxID=1605721 RepID=A0A0B5J9Z4_9VIRU|nr:hypothetical protein TW95_gp0947 [Pandoravirus inopinatum]AJF97681.1 hypothetical protein [Pandoravirus inopinatum]